MSRITLDTKCRLCRAEGTKLYLKGERCFSKCPIDKKGAVKPGMHGLRRSNKPSDYGLQLRAKQKAKRIYGVQETQFKNYFQQAKKIKGLVGDNLMSLLETRLDNVVYQSGLALSRNHAKQLISHSHVLVNSKPLNVNSYLVKVGDLISLDPAASSLSQDNFRLQDKDFTTPTWMEKSKKDNSVKIISQPVVDELNNDIDVNLIVEYYSR
ncbi:MAG: 30S ribosomal protein S4 [Patescibacteria group bacterium]|jgi:small subunit ribosomal protein S4